MKVNSTIKYCFCWYESDQFRQLIMDEVNVLKLICEVHNKEWKNKKYEN